MLYLAKRIHPQLVARCIYHGTIDNPRDPGPGHVHIYEMDKLPGTAYIMARDISANQPSEAKSRQLKTATDFAEFFAQSWRNNQYSDPNEAAGLLSEVKSTLRLLLRSRFPRQYLPNLLKVLEKLPLLFSGALPFVLSHQDLNEMNTLIDPETGSITGIIDWAEASILPFGFSLWGFENILGYMDSEGWHYFDNRRELEDAFWQTFWAKASNITESKKKLIRVARMAGLFYRYGFIWNGKTIDREVEASDASSIAYLDAFCMTDDW
ncbi:hypothetical protein TrVFT333_009199 [Trichoderma virens FT-333]|nr:hypothetical protein TrVFT333_009199 [Trichoderma virens FT-333]